MEQVTKDAMPKLEIEKIYLKDCSWEAPNSPNMFKRKWHPEVNVEIRNQTQQIEENHIEVTISIHISCKNEKKVAFIVEMEQAGVFLLKNIPTEERSRILSVICPNILFPYARETIDSLIVRGGYSALMLAPINFEVLYAQAEKKKSEQEQPNPVTH